MPARGKRAKLLRALLVPGNESLNDVGGGWRRTLAGRLRRRWDKQRGSQRKAKAKPQKESTSCSRHLIRAPVVGMRENWSRI
jgi:hypothetical protein